MALRTGYRPKEHQQPSDSALSSLLDVSYLPAHPGPKQNRGTACYTNTVCSESLANSCLCLDIH
jgi:hypothetical protein